MEPRDYGPFPYVPINDRPILRWPNGARLAVWIIPNIEFFPLTQGIRRQRLQFARAGAVGARLGAARLRQPGRHLAHHGGAEKHGVSASPTMNSDICDHHPQIVRACVELGWEILGHNETNSRWLNQMEPDEERQSIARALGEDRGAERQEAERLARRRVSPRPGTRSTICSTRASSTSPTGSATTSRSSWISAAANWSRSRIPTRSTTRRSCRPAIDTIDEFVTAIKRQFDTLYAEGARSGRVMAICLHPYLIGVPHRIKGLDDALSYIAAHDGVWFATGSEIVAGLARIGRDVLSARAIELATANAT